MTEEKPKKKLPGYIKWMISILVIIIIISGIRITLSSDWLFDKARSLIVETANEQLNGNLTIGSIRGDLLYGFTIYDITLTDPTDENVLQIDSVRTQYLIPSLIFSPHRLDLLRADGMTANLVQSADSTWNFETIIADLETDEDPEESDPLYWILDRLTIENLNLSVTSDILLPDGQLGIENLSFQGHAEMLKYDWMASAEKLEFQVREGRLPDPINIALSADASDNLYTLESLVINSGRSLLESKAVYRPDAQIEANADFAPLSWRDISAYVDDLPLQQDLSMQLSVGGSLNDLKTTVNLSSTGLEQLTLEVNADLSDPFLLKGLDLQIRNFNTPLFTGLEDTPTLHSFSLTGNGEIDLMNPEQAQWTTDLEIVDIRYEDHFINNIAFNAELENGSGNLTGSVQKETQEIALSAEVTDLFGELPEWNTSLQSTNTNLAVWLNDPELDSDLTISLNAVGRGFTPEVAQSQLVATITDGRFGEQHFSELRFEGELTPQTINGVFEGVIDQSNITANVIIDDWYGNPEYEYNLLLRNFNLTELNGIEQLPTDINGELVGTGRSFDFETLTLNAEAQFGESIINGERIETLRASFRVENHTLFVEEALLESPIADAEFSLRQHILDLQDLNNSLSFSAQIKDLYPLAPLFGVERVGSEGAITGRLAPNENSVLEFNGDLNLENVFVDTLFQAEQILGNAKVTLLEEIEIEAGLEFIEPLFGEIGVQDITLNATATLREDETTGELRFEIINDTESRLTHSGSYILNDREIRVTTDQIDFITPYRQLSLEKSFDISYMDETVSVDTLRLQSDDDDSYLKLWAPRVDSLVQNIGLDAKSLNIGVLQRTFVDASFVDAYLSGSVQLNNSPDSLYFSATGLLEEIQMENGEMDSLRFSTLVENEWLDADISAWHDDQVLFEGTSTVPFIPGDPTTFDDQFFDREIAGSIILNETPLEYWISFLPAELAGDQQGTLSFDGSVQGVAGVPEIDGNLLLTDGNLSGVSVDSIDVNFAYMHSDEQITISGSVISAQQKMMDFSSRLPFKLDLRMFEIMLPAEDDSIWIDLETNNFNLAFLNDFVDRDVIRQIGGRLDGKVEVTGPLNALETDGNMELSRGTARVVEAGITLTEIGSLVQFREDRIQLERFSVRSGPGRISASGSMMMENLVPGEISFQVRGNQFRAANTPQYNATIDLDTRLSGTFEEPNLRGSLSILNGFVNLQDFGGREIEDVRLEGEEEEDPFDLLEKLAIEMQVSFTRGFFIRNRQFIDLEIELGGSVDMVKERGSDLQMFGTVEGVRGYARPLGRNFLIEDAQVTFVGPVENPELNVRTYYDPPQAQAEIRIFYIIEGTAEDPQFRFDSEPQMELQDIISYTVFGKPFYELEGWEQALAGGGGGSAADVAIDILLDRFETLATQRLGIDVVQIDNTRGASGSTTSITTGWYLNRRTFFAIINEVSTDPKTLFLLEYLLLENLELLITQGDDIRQGIDLRWKYDY